MTNTISLPPQAAEPSISLAREGLSLSSETNMDKNVKRNDIYVPSPAILKSHSITQVENVSHIK